jgi:hypothetical protein
MDQGREVQRRHDEQTMTAIADSRRPVDFLAADEGSAEPELIAVEVALFAGDLR